MSINPETLVKIPGHDIPEPIDLDSIADKRITEVTNKRKEEFGVYLFEAEDPLAPKDMPKLVARWLHHRTLTENIVATEHEADLYRFEDVDAVVEKFLSDKGGRDLYLAIDENTRRLYGTTWFRKISKDDTHDFQLANAAHERLESNDIEFDASAGDYVATIATREYATAVKSDLELNLAGIALDDHFSRRPKCKGVIGRFGAKDNLLQELTDTEGKLPGDYFFREIKNGYGWAMLMATRDDIGQQFAFQYNGDTL